MKDTRIWIMGNSFKSQEDFNEKLGYGLISLGVLLMLSLLLTKRLAFWSITGIVFAVIGILMVLSQKYGKKK